MGLIQELVNTTFLFIKKNYKSIFPICIKTAGSLNKAGRIIVFQMWTTMFQCVFFSTPLPQPPPILPLSGTPPFIEPTLWPIILTVDSNDLIPVIPPMSTRGRSLETSADVHGDWDVPSALVRLSQHHEPLFPLGSNCTLRLHHNTTAQCKSLLTVRCAFDVLC